MQTHSRNWAGNYEYTAKRVLRPSSMAELQEIVRRSPKLKAFGTRHSFNDIADTPGDQVSTDGLYGSIEVDSAHRRVRVHGGVTYGRLCPALASHGLAVPNLASLPHISVAGACATATHGSGNGNGTLATAVFEIEIVTADGAVVTFRRGSDPDFCGAVVSLGGLGVVTALTLELVPSFLVAQEVYEGLPFEELEEHFDRVTGDAYSVSLFWDWKGPSINQVWFKRRSDANLDPVLRRFGATRAPQKLHPIRDIDPVNCTEQMGIAGRSFERLPHFRMDFKPSAGEELQSEYLVPRRDALNAIRALMALRDRFTHLLQISEIRTVAVDDLWMSPCYGRPCVGIHFTWKQDWPAVSGVLPEIEAALAPFSARPHWGKLFTSAPDRIAPLYERLPAFQRLLKAHDPTGKFRNSFLDTHVYG